MTPGTLVLRNGRRPGRDGLVDVEIRDGIVRRIGPRRPAGRAHETIELGGRWLIPGLWDNHVHFGQWAQTARRLDLSAARSAAEAAADVAAEVAARVASRPSTAQAGETLVGAGFRDALWPDAPGRSLLDAASGPLPVVLVSGDLHSAWLNSAALSRHGLAGHPTGLLREQDAFAVVRSLDRVAADVSDAWAASAAQAAAARGVVGVVDLEMDWNLDPWRRRIAAGTDSLRVEFGIYAHHLDRAIRLGLRSGDVIAGTGGLLRVGPCKVITDGSLNTRTAYCVDAYPGLEGRADARGLLTVPPDELRAVLRLAAGAGIRAAVHAIGDQANMLALDAFAELDALRAPGAPGAHGNRGTFGSPGGPSSIEHAQLLASADVARFARLGVVASVQPEHALDDRDVADRHWAGRTDRAFALRSLLDAGATLAFGSDAPVAPLDPWLGMAAAVGRTRDGREAWHVEQTISRQAALAASARGRDSVRAGDVADLAVCEIDPFRASVAELRRMPVAATVLGGRFTHSAL